MSKSIGTELNADLERRLSGRELESVADKVIQVFTVDEAGWAHPALLSYFEVVAKDRRNIRLATYAGSTTAGNMRRNGRLTLAVIDERVAYYVKGTVDELAPRMVATPENAKLNLRVERVLSDAPDPRFEPEAYIASGVRYRNPDRAAELAKARRLLAELLE
jgi:hypothetical protein